MTVIRREERVALVPLCAGSALGPFVGNMSNVLAPLLVVAFAIEKSQLSQAVIAHALPFSILQLFSGAISDRFGRRLTLLGGFGLFTLGSGLAAVAPSFEVFLVSRSLQGIANAFTTPLILATIGDAVPPGRLGRAIGVFTAINTSGQLIAPVLGGLLGNVTWRLPYAVLAVLSFVLTLSNWLWFRRYGSYIAARQQRASLGNLTRLLNARMAVLVSVSFLVSLGLMGPIYLYAIFLKDTWGLSPFGIGWLLAAFGVAGIIATRPAGRLADHVGTVPTAVVGLVGGVVGFVIMAVSPHPLVWAGAYALTGAGSGTIYTAINTLPVRIFPQTRGGAASLFQSGKFFAPVTAPFLFNPLYFGLAPRAAFVVQACILGLASSPCG